jgi:hypothetical protein
MIMKVLKFYFLFMAFFGAITQISPRAYAQCSNPVGTLGEIFYNESYSAFQGCMNNDTWQALHVVTVPTGCPTIGDVCSDGSVYAGLSPDGNVPMYTTPADAGQFAWSWIVSLPMENCSNGAQDVCSTGKANTELLAGLTGPFPAVDYCDGLNAHGHSDWYLPARNELAILRTNRTQIGGFDLTGNWTIGYYYSSSVELSNGPWIQRFSVGTQNFTQASNLSVRCVRNSAPPAEGTGYFIEGPATDGNMGGISGAAATCLSTLQSADWLGKSTAQSNGQLTAGNVRPWLCSSSACQDFLPNKVYVYASTSNTSRGGYEMIATAQGYLEDDGVSFSQNQRFGNNNGFRRLWTGRGPETQAPASTTCNNWTSNSNGIDGVDTATDISLYIEKLGVFVEGCDRTLRLLCIVDPPKACSGPSGNIGEIIYNSSESVFQGCTESGWQALHVAGSGGGGCSSPTGATGEIIYNTSEDLYQGCTADGWFALHQ